MNDIISIFKNDLYKLVNFLIKEGIVSEINIKNLSIDFSSKSKQGDVSTNLLLISIKKKIPTNKDLKTSIINYLHNLEYIEHVKIAKAGFINIFFNKNFLIFSLKKLFNNNKINYDFIENPKKINIEFVSANPTGPIHVAHMRGAIIGDVLSNLLTKVGHKVIKEYYVNDAGSQIGVLGRSLFKRYQQLHNIDIELSKGEYPGDYPIEIAEEIKNKDNDKWLKYFDLNIRNKYFESYSIKFLIDKIKNDLSLIDINFDRFTFESDIVKKKYIDKVFLIKIF